MSVDLVSENPHKLIWSGQVAKWDILRDLLSMES